MDETTSWALTSWYLLPQWLCLSMASAFQCGLACHPPYLNIDCTWCVNRFSGISRSQPTSCSYLISVQFSHFFYYHITGRLFIFGALDRGTIHESSSNDTDTLSTYVLIVVFFFRLFTALAFHHLIYGVWSFHGIWIWRSSWWLSTTQTIFLFFPSKASFHNLKFFLFLFLFLLLAPVWNTTLIPLVPFWLYLLVFDYIISSYRLVERSVTCSTLLQIVTSYRTGL